MLCDNKFPIFYFQIINSKHIVESINNDFEEFKEFPVPCLLANSKVEHSIESESVLEQFCIQST